MVIHRTANSPQ